MEELARIYIKEIVRLHGVPSTIISNRDPRFTSRFWGAFQRAFGTQLNLSAAYHPQTDGQSEKYQSPLCWYEAGERSLLGPEMIAETTEQIKKILRRAIKTKKLNPCYIGPFEILKRIGPMAYRIALPPYLSNLHDMFHVSQLQKYTPDAMREDLTLPIIPVRIDDTSVKRLRGKEVSLVKVAWSRTGIEEHTWELESDMQKDYPHLFSSN
ncbi:hypothetical protein AAHE18_17G101900 [Arachis hypogaea]